MARPNDQLDSCPLLVHGATRACRTRTDETPARPRPHLGIGGNALAIAFACAVHRIRQGTVYCFC